MIKFNRVVLAVLTCLMLSFVASEAKADPLVLTITNPTGTVTPGGTINLLATVVNSGAASATPVTISMISVSATGPGGGVINTIPFATNFLGQVVAPGATLGPLPFLSLTVPNFAVPGQTLSATFQFVYNSAVGVNQQTNSETLLYTVVTPSAPVPEPATMLLLCTGLVGIGAKIRKRRQGKEE